MEDQNATPATNNSHNHTLDKRTFWLGILGVIMAVLVAAHVMPEQQAMAGEAIDGRDYHMVTALAEDGSELLYVLEKRSGLLALLEWDPQTRNPSVRDIKPVQAAFGG